MDFIANHLELVFGIIAVTVFAILCVRAVKRAHRIDREGIETDAVVSAVKEHFDPDLIDSTYTTYVTYTDRDGRTVESPMTLEDSVSYEIGDKVRIKYIPGDTKMVRPVE